MSVKDIKEGIEKGKVLFGIRQTLKAFKDNKGKGLRVFIVKDIRDETVKKLEDAKIEFEVLKTKEEITKELGLDFECEVFLIK